LTNMTLYTFTVFRNILFASNTRKLGLFGLFLGGRQICVRVLHRRYCLGYIYEVFIYEISHYLGVFRPPVRLLLRASNKKETVEK